MYAGIATVGVLIGGLRWLVLYYGSLRASRSLYAKLLEAILFAKIRFHDTVSRGRILNRFGRDFEGKCGTILDHCSVNSCSLAFSC